MLHGFLLTATLLGDANGDGNVNINDLTIVLTHYRSDRHKRDTGEFTGSGTVDINDLTIVLANYDRVGAAAGGISAVPEPGALAALATALSHCWPMPGDSGSDKETPLSLWRRVLRNSY